jgi:penicillin amidase
MNLTRLALRLLGKRLPLTRGRLEVEGINERVVIHRDRFGVPHIEAGNDADAWYALGFCHGQDRPFQIETRLRVVRGTLSELIGPDGLTIDRLCRRIGIRRHGDRLVAALDDHHRALAAAYAAGVTAGAGIGLRRRPHPFVLLRSRPSRYEAADALGFLCLQAFLLAANWDVELARLQILAADGPEALKALDPAYPEWLPVCDRPGEAAGTTASLLAEDVAKLAAAIGVTGASNIWALASSRTATGRPILANDPHLAPLLPPHWYLVHLSTPEWSLAGASLAGTPAVAAGHNGHVAWGITASLTDNTDLFLEELGPDGHSVRREDDYVPCEIRRETIHVKGGAPEEIEVLITDRGPIVGPALNGEFSALSMAATWLQPRPLGAIFEMGRLRSFSGLRALFSDWAALPVTFGFADADGTIGIQYVGNLPIRRRGNGALPLAAADPRNGWEDGLLPFEELPHAVDPQTGYVVSANNLPSADAPLGYDYLDGYRAARISEVLEARRDWDLPSTLALQMDRHSIPWRELGRIVLTALENEPELATARALLSDWDGEVAPDSPSAALFELFIAEMTRAVAEAKAPRSAEWSLGKGFTPLVPLNTFVVRRVSHLVRLLGKRPQGWFPNGWEAAICGAVQRAVQRLNAEHGPEPRSWAWGEIRPLTLVHPLGTRRPLDRVFNLGPVPYGGDANTVNPAPVDPRRPTGNPEFAVASLRMVIDVGKWEYSRFVIPAGQSGNPFSPHYSDQLKLWRVGDALPIAWSRQAVHRATWATLTLEPSMPG